MTSWCLQEDSFDDTAEQQFLQFAEEIDDLPFAITKSVEVFSAYQVSDPRIVIFKQVRISLVVTLMGMSH